MVQGCNYTGTTCLFDVCKLNRIIGAKPAHGLLHAVGCVVVFVGLMQRVIEFPFNCIEMKLTLIVV